MKAAEMGHVIAIRKLFLVDNPTADIVVKLGKPQPTPGENDWFCTTQIVGIGNERIDATYGIDAFQALQLAMKWIGSTLSRLNELSGNKLRWEGDETGGFGFPSL
jgi:hypothetical protein